MLRQRDAHVKRMRDPHLTPAQTLTLSLCNAPAATLLGGNMLTWSPGEVLVSWLLLQKHRRQQDNPSPAWRGSAQCAATSESSLAAPPNVRDTRTVGPALPLLCMCPRKMKTSLHYKTCTSMQSLLKCQRHSSQV